MKSKLNKESLRNIFLEAMEKEYKVAISVTVPGCDKTEIIVNPPENLAAKLEYYSSAYNDDLVLKACPSIQIVDIISGSTITL